VDDSLLVRLYNVGLGDCIYVRVPDGDDHRHLLIDCGNKFSPEEWLREAIDDLAQQLPALPDGKRRLDLLVATHSHEDHVRGFDVDLFGRFAIGEIWLSAAMDPEHRQAEGARALQGLALASLERLAASGSPAFAGFAEELLALSKSDGMSALLEGLPAANGDIEPKFVHAETPEEDLALFREAGTRLRVLAPMPDIDGYYLGRGDQQAVAGVSGFSTVFAELAGDAPDGSVAATPANVSREDFELLRRQLNDSALAFVLKAGHLVNNTSVVLLLEWRGRRLLFTGDAECKTTRGGRFEMGKPNDSWNVMWEERGEHLLQPVDFLKVGHHGSHNATPWTADRLGDAAHPVNKILDNLLPLRAPGHPERYAVVSTQRTTSYEKIPQPELMAELGRRVSNVQTYEEPKVKGFAVAPDVLQPQRTDFDHQRS
jgi:hypothetical protein